ncbi:hypothetical protein D8O27_11815 [Burkholderia mallei]|uniref:Uncharacterized protein n=3 Tax=pseudomallei group TaxID=111527 RepID=A0A0H3HRA3_BURP2|nr:hypothetical protein BP1026B_I2179 [Burkholderia pseudomallei 1026b]ARK51264.1 hypothetical protein BOC35_35955 [Burkholderia pseudomallei]EIF53796.1 hypothetical protein BP1026A_5610 [Burkholderia pseudomallei 1026a]EIF64229.1 hypothetical protein BP1258A_1784 [Burkholderia pseudomallei 1258a]EIF66356.1 hypothetical protein BP1258B_1877 [Burkholderia pseudomallei 1258b]EIF76373.1 hypothetical protein BP354E_1634 [Burkholderia pseudomallei 354e]EIF80762.1 hypothetical protein BP354A_2021 [
MAKVLPAPVMSACAATAKSAPARPANAVCINFMRPPVCERMTTAPRRLGAAHDSNVTVDEPHVTVT